MVFKNIIFPRLECPFPESVSPLAETVQEHTLEWVRRHGLIRDCSAFEHLRKSKFGWLAARAYPNARLDRLEIVSDWNTWLFILDDQCDECGLGQQPTQLSALHARCLQTLCGKEPAPNDLPLVFALQNIYGRLQPIASQAWLTRFANSVSEYFEATVWEAQNRFHEHWPDKSSYIRMRPYTGGLYTDIEMIEITEQVSLPCIVRSNPRLNQLVTITNNVVCWCNDIISLRKEEAHGDMHNLVLILRQESKLSLQESINHVQRLIDNQIRRFMVFETQLPSFGTHVDHDVARFVGVLRSWMRGNLDWAYESGRYNSSACHPIPTKARGYANLVTKPYSVGALPAIEISPEG